jgi:Homeodomain-like domain
MGHGESSGAGVGAAGGRPGRVGTPDSGLERSALERAGGAGSAGPDRAAGRGRGGDTEIAEWVGVARQTVLTWRTRYRDRGLAGLDDIPKPGKPRRIDPRRIIAETLRPPPKRLGVTHWSTRLLGTRLKVGNSTIAKAWRRTASSRGGPARSGSPPTPNWRPRSSTWWACTWTRPKTRSCCAATRNPDPGAGTDRADPADR